MMNSRSSRLVLSVVCTDVAVRETAMDFRHEIGGIHVSWALVRFLLGLTDLPAAEPQDLENLLVDISAAVTKMVEHVGHDSVVRNPRIRHLADRCITNDCTAPYASPQEVLTVWSQQRSQSENAVQYLSATDMH